MDGPVTASIDEAFLPVNYAIGPGSNVVREPGRTSLRACSLALRSTILDANAFVEADIVAGIGLYSSVSAPQPFTICVNPFFGVELNAGVEGKVAFWDGEVGPFTFYENQFSIASRCFVPGSAAAAPVPARRALESYNGVGRGLGKRLSIPSTIPCPKKA